MTSLTEQLKLWAAGDCSYFGLLKSAPKATVARNVDGKKDPTAQKHRTHVLSTPDVCMQKLELPSRRKISAMAAGHDHVIICCGDQTLLSTGSNYFGQLGNGVDGMSQKAFSQLEMRLPIVSVACGASHTVMATLYGEMYSCGNNTSGQLGLGDFEGRLVPTRSDLSDSSVISVAAGDNHTLAVTKHGELFSFGNNCEGQLGISRLQDVDRRTFCNRIDDLKSTATPTRIQFEVELAASRHPISFEVLQLSCGSRHCAAIVRTWRMDTHEVISESDLFSWGSNQHGQLGKPQDISFQGIPRWVQIHPAQYRKRLPDDFRDPPRKVQHDDPSSMMWYESSGTTDPSDDLLKTITVKSVNNETSSQSDLAGDAGAPHTGAAAPHTGRSKIESFNRMNANNKKFEELISLNKAPVRVACGAEFTLIVTEDGCLYACGSSEKGQLGVKGMSGMSLKDRYTPTLVTALHSKKVSDVACGHEHAFALVQGGGEVYAWGRNTEAQLGLTACSHVPLPTLLPGVKLLPDDESIVPKSHTDYNDLASIQRSCASVVAGVHFSLLGRIDVDGFPKEEPAQNLKYNISGDVLVCVLGVAIPRCLPMLDGTPPFLFSVEPALPEGLHLDAATGQIRGAAVVAQRPGPGPLLPHTQTHTHTHAAGVAPRPGLPLLRFTITARNECCPKVTAAYTLQLRIVEPPKFGAEDKAKKRETDELDA